MLYLHFTEDIKLLKATESILSVLNIAVFFKVRKNVELVCLPSCPHTLPPALIVARLLICGCKRNTNGHSKPHHRHRVRCHARGEKTIEETGSTFEATTYSVPFCSTHYFACPFSEILKCHRNVSSSLSGAAPDKELLTFYGFPSVLSAINGDLSLEGKAFDLPQPEETRLSAFHFKSQIHVGLPF